MAFNLMEYVIILKEEGLTDLEISTRVGVVEKTIRSIKNSSAGIKRASEKGLLRVAIERCKLPWNSDAHEQAQIVLKLIEEKRFDDLHNSYAFSAKVSIDLVSRLVEKDSLSDLDWGQLLFCYVFLLGMQLSASSNHSHYHDSNDWTKITEALISRLESINEAWAQIFRYKVTGNVIVCRWKRTFPRRDRGSAKMMKSVDDSNYFKELITYNDLVPREPVAPFNALAIASRFKRRKLYKDLWERLQKSDRKYSNLDSVQDDDFDDDFEDFFQWVNENEEVA